ncbi:MAG: hypothetical protein HZC55_16835 [Verrucomicrobia bacterium]|nr:hypothetical protein [Verrucomicrobiota bacterium]
MSDLILLGAAGALLLGALIAAVQQVQHVRARQLVAAQLLSAAAGFQHYLKENGALPEDADASVVPKGMDHHLDTKVWTAPTPVGGHYRWNHAMPDDAGATTLPPHIAITAFSRADPLRLTPIDLLAIDRQIDDGDLGTGSFRRGFNGWPVLLVRGQP